MEAGARDLKGFGGDLSDQVEIDEAVVDRGNERVGARRKVAREDIVAPRRVGDEIVGALGQARDRGVEFVDGRALEHLEARHRQRDVAALRRAGALLQIAMERSEEHTSELQSLMRISYAVFCLKTTKNQKKQ